MKSEGDGTLERRYRGGCVVGFDNAVTLTFEQRTQNDTCVQILVGDENVLRHHCGLELL